MYNRSFFLHRLRMSVSYSEAGMNVPTFSRFRMLLRLCRPHEPWSMPQGRQATGQAGYRAAPPRVWSRQAGTVAQEAVETVRLVSIKGPRSAESTRNPSPATRRFWVLYMYIYASKVHVYVGTLYCSGTGISKFLPLRAEATQNVLYLPV